MRECVLVPSVFYRLDIGGYISTRATQVYLPTWRLVLICFTSINKIQLNGAVARAYLLSYCVSSETEISLCI